jgi:hypothetical protein
MNRLLIVPNKKDRTNFRNMLFYKQNEKTDNGQYACVDQITRLFYLKLFTDEVALTSNVDFLPS